MMNNDELIWWFISILPWYALMTFGSICLGKLGIDLILFNDYPEEIKKLEMDIHYARIDLNKRGYK